MSYPIVILTSDVFCSVSLIVNLMRFVIILIKFLYMYVCMYVCM